MIDGGLLVMLLGAGVLALPPVERLFSARRWIPAEMIEPALRRSFPLPPPEQQLERLVNAAEAAVQSAALRRAEKRRTLRRLRRH